MMKRMRRRVLIMLLFVCIGICTTYVIAWAAVWWRPMGSATWVDFREYNTGKLILSGEQSGPAWSVISLYGYRPRKGAFNVEPNWHTPWWIDLPIEEDEEYAAVLVSAGWPFKCIGATCGGIAHHDPPPGGAWRTGLGPQWVEWLQWKNALGDPDVIDPPGPAYQRVLPTNIHPSAVVFNILFWSFAWWLLWFGPSQIRHRLTVYRRTKRGECPACGYDLRGELAGGCSECGWARHGTAQR